MIDLHCHSTASDGTLAPGEISRLGSGCAIHALTDHDTVAGIPEFLSAPDGAPQRLAGIELSVEPGSGYGRFHLLGLGIDPRCPALHHLLGQVVAGRRERNPKIVEKLRNAGLDITMRDVEACAGGEIVARPHIARALMEKGFVASVKEAFAKWLGNGKPAFVPRWRPDPEEAFSVIHEAGGVAIMAHPKFWTENPAFLRAGLARLSEAGLDGLEVYYSANTIDETRLHLVVARELGLLQTAGSDFHGDNKPDVPFGMNPPEEKELVAALLAAVSRRKSRPQNSRKQVRP